MSFANIQPHLQPLTKPPLRNETDREGDRKWLPPPLTLPASHTSLELNFERMNFKAKKSPEDRESLDRTTDRSPLILLIEHAVHNTSFLMSPNIDVFKFLAFLPRNNPLWTLGNPTTTRVTEIVDSIFSGQTPEDPWRKRSGHPIVCFVGAEHPHPCVPLALTKIRALC